MSRRLSTQTGFTLLELSIVIIIVGLILGGVVMGRDLIRKAQARSVITDIEQIQSSLYAFRQKYQTLPGDFSRAESYWGSDSGCPIAGTNTEPKTVTCNGNGNGIIDSPGWVDTTCGTSSPTASTYQQEAYRLWQHMVNANLYRGRYTGVHGSGGIRHGVPEINIPDATKIPQAGYQIMNFDGVLPAGNLASANWFQDRYYHILFIGRQLSTGCGEPNSPFLSSLDAYDIDVKSDDGKPGTGKLRTFTLAAHSYCATSNTASTAAYSLNNNPRSCAFIQLLDWW